MAENNACSDARDVWELVALFLSLFLKNRKGGGGNNTSPPPKGCFVKREHGEEAALVLATVRLPEGHWKVHLAGACPRGITDVLW